MDTYEVLYDYIEQDLANKYNEYKKSLGFSHPHSLPCLPTG